MKRLTLGILITTLLGGCTVGTPVADKTNPDGGAPTGRAPTEAEFLNGVPAFCEDTCQRFGSCPDVDVASDCLYNCVTYMSAFVSHGDACVALGVELEGCVDGVRTCDDYANPPPCMQDTSSHDLCAARASNDPGAATPTCLGCDPTCDVYGGGGGPVDTGGPPVVTTCQLNGDGCSDGSMYQLRCNTVQGALTCSCFKNGEVSGTFESQTGCPPSTSEQYMNCGWALDSTGGL